MQKHPEDNIPTDRVMVSARDDIEAVTHGEIMGLIDALFEVTGEHEDLARYAAYVVAGLTCELINRGPADG